MVSSKSTTPYLLVAAILIAGLAWLLYSFATFVRANPNPLLGGMFKDALVIGLVTMAAIQWVRYLLPLRGAFHRRRVEEALDPLKLDDVMPALGDDQAFFDLPIEQLFGQVGAAFSQIVARASDRSRPSEDVSQRITLFQLRGWLLKQVPEAARERTWHDLGLEAPAVPADVESSLRARVALEESVRRALDRIQIEISHAWQLRLRLAALGVSLALAVAWQFATQTSMVENVSAVLFVGVLGGFVAIVSRDLVAVVEKLRR